MSDQPTIPSAPEPPWDHSPQTTPMQTPPQRDLVTTREFGMFVDQMNTWKAELNTTIRDGFAGVKTEIEKIAEQTNRNTEELIETRPIMTQVERTRRHAAILSRDVRTIEAEGCAFGQACPMRKAAIAATEETARRFWTEERKAIARGGAYTVTTGAIILALIKLLQSAIPLVQGGPK